MFTCALELVQVFGQDEVKRAKKMVRFAGADGDDAAEVRDADSSVLRALRDGLAGVVPELPHTASV